MPVGLFLPGPGPYVELGLGKAPDGLVPSRAFPTTSRLENPSNPGGNGDNVSPLDGWNTVYAGNVGTWQRLNAHYALADTHNEPGVVALTAAAWRGTSYADTSGFLAEAPQFSEVEVWATMVSAFTDLTLGTNAEVLVSCHIDPADGGFGVSSEDSYPYDEGVFGGIADHGSGPVLTLFYQDFSQTRPYTVDSAAISPVAGCSFGLYAHPANGDGTYTVDLYYAPNGSDWPSSPNLTLTYTPDFAGSPPSDRTGGVPGLIGIAARSIGSAVSNNGTEIFSQFGGGTPVTAGGGATNVTLNPPAATAPATAAVPVPTVALAPPAASAPASVPVPVPTVLLAPPAATAPASAPVPTVTYSGSVTVPAALAPATAAVPVVLVALAPPAASAPASATPPVPTIQLLAPAALAPASATPPTITLTGNVVINATAAAASASAGLPVPTVALAPPAAAAPATARVPVPTVSLSPPAAASPASAPAPVPTVLLGPPTALAPATAPVPALSVGGSITLNIPAATAPASAAAPVPTISLTPPAATAPASVPVPTVKITLAPPAAQATATGTPPIPTITLAIPAAAAPALARVPVPTVSLAPATASATAAATGPAITGSVLVIVTGHFGPPAPGRAFDAPGPTTSRFDAPDPDGPFDPGAPE